MTGEIAALAAAFLWAASSLVYALLGERVSPLLLNLCKGAIAIVYLAITIVLMRQPLPNADFLPISSLLLSGAIGIGLGDSAYFTALNQLGARRTLLLEMLAPPIAALLALIFLGETLKITDWWGIFLILIGVIWVIAERTAESVVPRSQLTRGVVWGILAAIAQAVGAVLSRFALVESNVSPLWSTLLRLMAGTLTVTVLWLVSRPPSFSLRATFSLKLLGAIALTAFGSTYLGVWLQQISLKFAPAGIAQTLSSTSPLFVIPFALAMGEKVSWRAIFGVMVALTGIGILYNTL